MRANSLPAKLAEILRDAPRAMVMSEIAAALEFAYEPGEISSALAKLKQRGTVVSVSRERCGPGRRLVQAYSLKAVH